MATQSPEASGRLAFTVVGGLATGGAWYGYLIGGIVGSYLFPPKFEKPEKYTELGLNSSALGIPIPLLYGTARIAGQYIWKGPLASKSIKASGGSSGLSGTGRPTVGYKYYMYSAVGLCSGPAYCSRIWKNNDPIRHEGDARIVQYEGTQDQTTDPTIASYVNNPVPYRGLAYNVYNRYPLGENNNQSPVWLHEMHRYPFNANAGSSARVYNTVNQFNGTGLSTWGGYAKKRADGMTILVSNTFVKLFDVDMTLTKTWDISGIIGIGASKKLFDIDITEAADGGALYILFYISPALKVLRIALNNTFGDGHYINLGGRYAYAYQVANDSYIVAGQLAHNSTNTFVSWRKATPAENYIRVAKYGFNNFNNPLALYDLTSDCNPVYFGALSAGLTVSKNYAFVGCDGKIHSFDTATFTKIDEINVGSFTSNVTHIEFLPGGDEIVFLLPDATDGYKYKLFVIGFDSDGDNLTFREKINIQNLWQTPPTLAQLAGGVVKWNYDGTLTLSYQQDSTHSLFIQQIIGDINPAQIFYDLLVNDRQRPESEIELTSLQTLSDYCRDNRVGLSGAFIAEENLADALRTIAGYIHGLVFENPDGKWQFVVFKNDDPVDANTIDENAIAVCEVQDDSGFDDFNYKLIGTMIKDKRQKANRINIQYTDRIRNYRDSGFLYDFFMAQEADDEIVPRDIEYRWFSNVVTAGRQAVRLAKQEQYDDKVFSMILLPRFYYMKQGEVFQLNLPSKNLTNKIRILSVDEPPLDVGGGVQVTAKLEADYLNTFEDIQYNSSLAVNTAVDIPTDIEPIIIEQTALHNEDSNALLLGYIRNDDSAAGANIYVSEDGSTYHLIGTVGDPLVIGDIAQAVGERDRDIVVNIDNYFDVFASYSITEQRAHESLSIIGERIPGECGLTNFEFLAFREVETSGSDLILKNCYRGKYYTIRKPHTTDEVFIQFGVDRYAKYLYPETKVGKTIYVKLQPFNIYGDGPQIDDLEVFEYQIKGYTRKATHGAGFQIDVSGSGQRSISTVRTGGTPNRNVKVTWRNVARDGGISRVSIDVWPWNRFIPNDVDNFDVLIYNTSGVLIAEHIAIGFVFEYTYMETQNVTDFGGFTSQFFIGIRPTNLRGIVPDVVKIPVFIDP